MLWRFPPLVGFFLVLWGAALSPSEARSQAYPDRSAQTLLREALHREALGLAGERSQLLAEAATLAPHEPGVHWAQGRIRQGEDWVGAEALVKDADFAAAEEQYRLQRNVLTENPESHLQLADWCRDHSQPQRERAHLLRVLDFAPDHADARARLGFIRVAGRWVLVQEITAALESAARARADFSRWSRQISEIGEGLQSPFSAQRRKAADELSEIRDPSALVAIESLLVDRDSPKSEVAISAIAAMPDPSATQSLARLAVYAPHERQRRAAADQLRERPLDDYIPQLLATLSGPIRSRVELVTGPGARLIHRQVFTREGDDQNEEVVVARAYDQLRMRRDRRQGMTTLAQMLREQREQEGIRMAQNAVIADVNERIVAALVRVTGEKNLDSPQDWWQWWNDRNEVYLSGEKPTQTMTVAYDIPASDRSQSSFSGSPTAVPVYPRRLDCLARGTPVWTSQGKCAVDKVRVGDLVLSQNVDTGELAYQPVLRTTIRPAAPLVRIEVGRDDYLETSGGHLFWVAGQGWGKARELRSGDHLHTSRGFVTVSDVTTSPAAPTYNLVVEDFHTYFAGEDRILSHDNTLRAATSAIVPGLVPGLVQGQERQGP